jgi:sodium-dependent phosphate cotransporter
MLLLVFLIAIRGLGTGFTGLGQESVTALLAAIGNPFAAVALGIFGTALLQSSSVSTSMIVALVAAPQSPLPIAHAIPMIMGANIGTTVTSTLVALGHVGRPEEFRRALTAATCHDFFNCLAVAVLFPLELATGFLERLSGALAAAVTGVWASAGAIPNPIKAVTQACVEPVDALLRGWAPTPTFGAVLMIALSAALILGSVTLLVRDLRAMAAGRINVYIARSLDASPVLEIVVGLVITVMVQSSSITTSVLVPLAAAGLVQLRQVFAITVGANVGTTFTALMASLGTAQETAQLAVQIACAHLLFNLAAVALIYPWAPLRQVPIALAEWLARRCRTSRRAALVYTFCLFYGIPVLVMLVPRLGVY